MWGLNKHPTCHHNNIPHEVFHANIFVLQLVPCGGRGVLPSRKSSPPQVTKQCLPRQRRNPHFGQKKTLQLDWNGFVLQKNGAPTRTRTLDPMIKSHLLYRLSYGRTKSAITRTSVKLAFANLPLITGNTINIYHIIKKANTQM